METKDKRIELTLWDRANKLRGNCKLSNIEITIKGIKRNLDDQYKDPKADYVLASPIQLMAAVSLLISKTRKLATMTFALVTPEGIEGFMKEFKVIKLVLLLNLAVIVSVANAQEENSNFYQQRIQEATDRIKANPNNYIGYSQRAIYKAGTKDLLGALQDIDVAIEKLPEDNHYEDNLERLLKRKASLLIKLNRYDDAYKLVTSFKCCYFERAEIEMIRGNYDKSLSSIDTYENERNTDYATYLSNKKKFMIYFAQGNFAMAENKFWELQRDINKPSFGVFLGPIDDREIKSFFAAFKNNAYDALTDTLGKWVFKSSKIIDTKPEKLEIDFSPYIMSFEALISIYSLQKDYNQVLDLLEKQKIINPYNVFNEQRIINTKYNIRERNKNDRTAPSLIIQSPKAEDGVITLSNENKITALIGKAFDQSGISTVLVNGQPVLTLSNDGIFKSELTSGVQKINIKATDIIGNITAREFLIRRVEQPQEKAGELTKRNLHAILIACSKYGEPRGNLATDVDSKKLKKILSAKYGLLETNLEELSDPSASEIKRKIESKLRSLNDQDDIIIYYGGHGYYKDSEGAKIGYWIPTNTFTEEEHISSNTLDKLVRGTKARHVLIISDACFGGFMRVLEPIITNEPKSTYTDEKDLQSRQVLTSSNEAPAPAGSTFMDTICNILEKNSRAELSITQLSSQLIVDLMNIDNARQSEELKLNPRLSSFGTTGNNYGEFYFYIK